MGWGECNVMETKQKGDEPRRGEIVRAGGRMRTGEREGGEGEAEGFLLWE